MNNSWSGGLLSPRSNSPASGGGRSPVTSPVAKEIAAMELIEEVNATSPRKPVDRVAILSRLNKAVILSEGVLTFHALPSLAPLSVHSFPSLRGVTTFSLDEDELSGGGQAGVMHLCAIKRRSVHLLKITQDASTQLKDLPLRGGALISVFRRGHVCIADTENYSIINFEEAIALPLLPISQAPNLDDPPEGASTGGIDPRQRPAVACVGANEFLIASHTANTTLGVFVTEGGEPCRGTLEWASNVRSLAVDPVYAIALLHNNTVEIHSLRTQEIAQVVHLPTSSSPLGLQPRSLAYSWSGVDLGEASGANKYASVSISLLPTSPAWPPSTPTKQSHRMSISSPMGSDPRGKGRGTVTRTLIVGKNSLFALTPLTLVVQADALMDKGRLDDALAMADQIEKGTKGARTENPELCYVYLRAAYLSLALTHFQDSFNLFLRSCCDPRLVIRLFPDLRSPLMGTNDQVSVCRGVLSEVQEAKTVDSYIMANLTKNYSPHLKPDVETAPSTIELRATLGMTARDCLFSYLQAWRAIRRSQGLSRGSADDSRKVDMTVDTTLARLLVEEKKIDELFVLLESPNDCVIQEVEPTLLKVECYDALATILFKRGEVSRALDIWTKIADGEYEDDRFQGGARRIFELLWQSGDKALIERYGLWLIKNDRALGLQLFSDPKQTIVFETRDLLDKIRSVDPEAADLYLEGAVLQDKDTDHRLQSDLVNRYIDRLGELLNDSATQAHLREQNSTYATSSDRSSFLSFLCSSISSDTSSYLEFDRVRLKAVLFLSRSKNYDMASIKSSLESGPRAALLFERAIVYGQLHLDRQALSLLAHSLGDLVSAETYARQAGDLLDAKEIARTTEVLALPLPPSTSTKPSKRREASEGESRKKKEKQLMRLLVDVCLSRSGDEETKIDPGQTARFFTAQGMHLDPLMILDRVPPEWPLELTTTFWSRALRRSLHARHEALLLKGIAMSDFNVIDERLGDLQVSMAPTKQTQGPTAWDDAEDEKVLTEIKVLEKGYKVDEDDVDLT